MSLLKRSHRISVVALLALSLVTALFSSCAGRKITAEGAEDAEKKEEESLVSTAELDKALAQAATEALGDLEGAVLVMDPHTGRLRAVVNPRLAFEQAYPPGSTIKSFTALTAMKAGLIDDETRTLCRERFTGDNLDIVCSHPKSKTPFNLSKALAYSCNYFFATMSGRLSFEAFKSTLASAGLGGKTGVNASGESAGKIGGGEWRVRDLLGEGDNLLVTPIQLLTGYCALMNGGRVLRPQIAEAEKFIPEERAMIHVEPSQRTALIEGMRGAVKYGTAVKAELSSLPIFIFGKTGTSTSSNGFRRQGWFVSFAADANSAAEATPESLELAVLVLIKRSHGSEAAQVSRRVFDEVVKNRPGDAARRGAQRPGDGETVRAGDVSTLRVKILSEDRIVTVPVEDYVLGVLSVEATLEDEIEALKAQAIISRTYALKNRGRHGSEGFDVCSNTHCQQYMSGEGRASEKMMRAVADTNGKVLLEPGGKLAEIYFSAACGGMTANIETLWGEPGPSYLRGVRDDYCESMPNHHWTDEIPAAKLASALASDPLSNSGRTVHDIVITRMDPTGRAQLISIEGERRRQVRGWDFKLIVGRALGWNLLKSSRFNVERHGSTFVFRGSGFGHGLGLCQSGAHVMAGRGASCEQILDHYFPGTRRGTNATTPGREVAEADVDRWRHDDGAVSLDSNATLRLCVFALNSRLTLSSEHFRVSYPAGVARVEIESMLRTLEVARLDMLARAGPESLSLRDAAINVVIHETTQDFSAATGQPWWVAGITHGHELELQPLNILRRRRILKSTLRHEYTHAVIEEIGQGRAPRWLAEGLAIAFAGEGPFLARFKPRNRLPLDELERRLASPRSAAEMRSSYASAYAEVRALIQKEGEPSVWRRLKLPHPAGHSISDKSAAYSLSL
jgi:stage II sporulation protein D